MKSIKLLSVVSLLAFGLLSAQAKKSIPQTMTISKERLMDKIKGGWAAQTIACTYGGPTEFVYRSAMIQDYIPIEWPDGHIKWYYDKAPTLYDDIYMDLTFVDVMEKYGLDCPIDSFATAFANAGYNLWHGNQAARYNILHGIMPPASGHWMNNPHSDDIDFQIESDFAGLMTPGMPNSAVDICDRVGHIMCYGNGWYGGVYVAAMYSLAFVSDNVEFIVEEALKTIPKESTYYQCMADVIKCHKKYPNDWKQAWAECEKHWNNDNNCPEGAHTTLNIEALLNSAYVVIGLLYGDGDFYKTIDIATRCGQDSDCNPATAGGILATIKGYSWIPEYWMKNLHEVEDRDFAYTTMSLNKTYAMSFKHALQMIERNGGKVDGDNVTIVCQKPVPTKLEVGFEGLVIKERRRMNKSINNVKQEDIEGTGVAFEGSIKSDDSNYVAKVEVYMDGKLMETADLPASYKLRRVDLFWKYNLPKGKHTFTFKWLNPEENKDVFFHNTVVYTDELPPVPHK